MIPQDPPERSPRSEALRILTRVEETAAYADILLEAAEARQADRRDAALLHEIVLGVLRNRSRLDHVLAAASERPVEKMDGPVRNLLRIGAHSLLLLDRVPAFAAVDTAVELAKSSGGPGSASFVNAVLRRITREGARLLPAEPRAGDVEALALHRSHPLWWTRRAVERLGWDGACSLLAADNLPAPTVARPNLRKTTPRDLARRLDSEGVATEPGVFVPEALRIVSGIAPSTRAFREGFFWIQDEASQLVPRLFGRVLRRRVLDLCAAPGAKSMQLSEGLPSGGAVVAVDRNAKRLTRLLESSRRLFLPDVLPLAADARQAALAGTFDHVLVDAPCSGTGTLRRHPEIRFRLEERALRERAATQRAILEAGAALLDRGGTLVYSVCSLEPEEGPDVVAAFLEGHADFGVTDAHAALPAEARRLLGPDGALRTSPADGGVDGFFAVALGRAR